jgi:hypothetical protein
MTLEEHIENKLSEKFPGKKFRMIGAIDEVSFKPLIRLSVNGKQTHWSLNLDTVADIRALHGYNDEKIAYDFAQNVTGIAHL